MSEETKVFKIEATVDEKGNASWSLQKDHEKTLYLLAILELAVKERFKQMVISKFVKPASNIIKPNVDIKNIKVGGQ